MAGGLSMAYPIFEVTIVVQGESGTIGNSSKNDFGKVSGIVQLFISM